MWPVILPFILLLLLPLPLSGVGGRGLPALTSLLTCFFSFVYFYLLFFFGWRALAWAVFFPLLLLSLCCQAR